jgi:putative ABC transport system permease protein
LLSSGKHHPNRRRTVLTILSIALSLFLLSTPMTVLTELGRESPDGDQHLRLVVRRASSLGDPLPESYLDKLKRTPGVRMVHTLSWFGGIYGDERNFFANFGCDPETLFPMFNENRIPPEQLAAFKKERTAAVAGRKLAERFKWRLGDKITLQGTIYPVDGVHAARDLHRARRDGLLLPPRLPGRGARAARKGGHLLAQGGVRGGGPRRRRPRGRHVQKQRCGDQDGDRAGISAGLRLPAGEHQDPDQQHLQRRRVHHPLGHRQHHGYVDPGAGARDRRPENADSPGVGSWSPGAESAGTLAGGLLGTLGARLFYSLVDVWKHTQGFFPIFVVEPETIAVGLLLSVLIGVTSAAVPAYRVSQQTIAHALRRTG